MDNNEVMSHVELNDEVIESKNEVVHSELEEDSITYNMSEDSDYLEHYGIKGMKWGIRRFQNKDGSLTKAGLKRYSDAASDVASKVGKAVAEGGKKIGQAASKAAKATADKISEKHAERKEEKRIEKLMSKPIRKLTEAERIERMDRKMKEKELRTLEKSVNDLSDGAISKGRKFAEDMVTKVAMPAVINAGEKQLTAFLNKKLGDALGLGEKDTTLVKDLLTGTKQLTDLTDSQINKVGKAGESYGNALKNFFGKNSDQNDDSGDTGTLFKDIMSGKLKTSDLNDGQLNKGKKLAEAADALNKQKQKVQSETASTTESKPESKPKAETESPKPKESSKPKETSKSNDDDMDRILNSNIDDLSNEDLAKADKWLKSIGF